MAVYPRPRGGAFKRRNIQMAFAGLSPPTRGSHDVATICALVNGSIPAHAGEPWSVISALSSRTVYPRPRGGAAR